MTAWHEHPQNIDLINRLRDLIAGNGRVLIFLGAGLSFGAARQGGRARFDNEKYWPEGPAPFDVPGWSSNDDGLPLPSWPWLVQRMLRALLMQADDNEHDALAKFFIEEGPLDCAQLFRQTVGEANYGEFLRTQFEIERHPFVAITPSHQALVALDLPLLFTTNYDELIEAAYREAGQALRVSVSEEQFVAHRTTRPARHLVKLHGSIDQLNTVVLTRADYARTRSERKEMFAYLRNELADSAFLFVGFSLSDPNFGLIHDDIRLVYGMNMPASYAVQAQRNVVKQRYLQSLDVNTVWLDSWNHLPDFFRRINPALTELL